MTSSAPTTTGPQPARRLALIDADVHPNFLREWSTELAPYLSEGWRVRISAGAAYQSEVARMLPGTRYSMPTNPFYPKGGGNLRVDLLKPGAPLPGADPDASARLVFDENGADRALLIPQAMFGVGVLPDADLATVLAAATNDWLRDRWLSRDRRWRATLVVAPQDPLAAAEEIERRGVQDGFAGVFISVARPMLGDRHFHPIFAAAERHRLPIVVHPTGTEGIYANSTPVAGGAPAFHMDFRVSFLHPYQMNLASLIANGVFERFPRLDFLFAEVGYAWLPDFMWRLDSYWKSGREETPWVTRPPSQYILDRVRFTTQPFIEPPRRGQVGEMLEMISAGRTLLFSSDFPHWDEDDPKAVIADIPERMRQPILVDNALALFGERMAS